MEALHRGAADSHDAGWDISGVGTIYVINDDGTMAPLADPVRDR
jgi:hypothetical protein